MLRVAAVILSIVLILVACCNPPATQSLSSSFTATVSAQLSPNQITVMYGSKPLTLMFDQVISFAKGQELYVQGKIAGDVVKVTSVTSLE
jgi:hypothetical protein